MEIFIRTIAVIIEVAILAAIMYSILRGIGLAAFDLGLGSKYKRIIAMLLILVGGVSVVFFTAHLTSLYPAVQIG